MEQETIDASSASSASSSSVPHARNDSGESAGHAAMTTRGSPNAAVAAASGSDFLLLAAEAYEAAERTQRRADAIRRVANDLANAAAAEAATNNVLQSSASSLLKELRGGPHHDPDAYSGDVVATRMQKQPEQEQQQASTDAQVLASASDVTQVEGEEERSPSARSSNVKNPLLKESAISVDLSTFPGKGSDKGAFKNDDDDVVGPEFVTTKPFAANLSSSLSSKLRPKPPMHAYHDYSDQPDSGKFVRKKTGGVTVPFPEKLMNMLENESVHRPDIVSWSVHGRSFVVRRPRAFALEVMAGYFRQSKITSFQRQLNLYGFRRITQGRDAGAYYHEMFLRGKPHLLAKMVRQKVKGTGHKQPTDVSSEPNFYAMPCLGVATAKIVLPPTSFSLSEGASIRSAEDEQVASPPLSVPHPGLSISSPGMRAATTLRRLSTHSDRPPPPPLSMLSAPPSAAVGVVHGFNPPSDYDARANAAAMTMTTLWSGESDGSTSRMEEI